MQQKLAQARSGKKSGAQKWIAVGAVVVILGVGGYLGYGPATEWWAKRKEAGKQAGNTATQQVASATASNAAPAEPAVPPPPKELPVIPPAWTLDLDKANIPNSKVNGVISGTNFLAENALCFPQPASLRLFQGAANSPDAEILIYLHLNAGEAPAGHNWNISQDMKDHSVPQVVKRWKTNPKYAPLSKSYSYGYAMKLELGDLTNGVMPGKIYVALPDTEQTVVAGLFKATTPTANRNNAAAATPGMMPTPGAMPMGPGPASSRAAYERYRARKQQ